MANPDSAPVSPQTATKPPKKPCTDGRRNNRPPPPKPEHSDKRTYHAQLEPIIELAAERVLAGKSFAPNASLGPVTPDDKQLFKRITGISAEQFNERLSQKLAVAADMITDLIVETAEAKAFKPSELGFTLAVLEDKRARLDGRTSLQSSTVNVQVNNYGPTRTRDELLTAVSG